MTKLRFFSGGHSTPEYLHSHCHHLLEQYPEGVRRGNTGDTIEVYGGYLVGSHSA